MPADKSKRSDYENFSKNVRIDDGGASQERASLKPLKNKKEEIIPQTLLNPLRKKSANEEKTSAITVSDSELKSSNKATIDNGAEKVFKEAENSGNILVAETGKSRKKNVRAEKDFEILGGDNWLARNGHGLTFAGLYFFTFLVYFRPYELIPALGFLSATAFYFALATILIYLPTQISTEGNLTAFPTEVKAVLALTLIALLTMPIAKSPGTAWQEFNDPFIKAVLMFIVMVNVLRTRRRLVSLIWLSLAMGVYLSYSAWQMYLRGEFAVEDYRVSVDIGGMFGNPNDLAIHLVIVTPLAIALGIAAKNKVIKLVYFAMAALFIMGNFVTYSRGGFLGLMTASAILIWKFGRKHRLNVTLASILFGGFLLLAAPGNYGLRMLSILVPGLDPVGSSNQRKQILERSIMVSLRNPWGIGIGNFPIVGINNLVSHNSYTQVSSELGVLGLIAYLVFMISPIRKLGAIERTQFNKGENGWFYCMSIGIQASIAGYMVSSFFGSVAYTWYIYYLIAYAVAFRRIYQIEKGLENELEAVSLKEKVLGYKNAWQNA